MDDLSSFTEYAKPTLELNFNFCLLHASLLPTHDAQALATFNPLLGYISDPCFYPKTDYEKIFSATSCQGNGNSDRDEMSFQSS